MRTDSTPRKYLQPGAGLPGEHCECRGTLWGIHRLAPADQQTYEPELDEHFQRCLWPAQRFERPVKDAWESVGGGKEVATRRFINRLVEGAAKDDRTCTGLPDRFDVARDCLKDVRGDRIVATGATGHRDDGSDRGRIPEFAQNRDLGCETAQIEAAAKLDPIGSAGDSRESVVQRINRNFDQKWGNGRSPLGRAGTARKVWGEPECRVPNSKQWTQPPDSGSA